MKNEKVVRELIEENERLRIRLQEAEDTIAAIREGAVDAVIVQGAQGDRVFTLSGEDVIYRRLVETMHEAGLTVTPEGTVLFCNQRFADMVRLPMEEIIGHPVQRLIEPSSRGDLAALLEAVQAGPCRQRLVFRSADGTSIPSQVGANVLRQGDLVSVCLVVSDTSELETEIADRRHAEETARRERQRLYDVLETLPVYVLLLTPDYHVPFANRFFRERFGESGARRRFEYLFDRTEPCEDCQTYTVLKTMQPHHWEWTGPDGRTYDIYDFPFTEADGSTLILEMGIDITEQRQAEAELVRYGDQLQQMVEERTRELEAANEKLQVQAAVVATRAEELRVSNEELRRHDRTLRQLAQFPKENPNPVVRVAADGSVLHLNAPARNWLVRLGWRENDLLPEVVRTVVANARGHDHTVEAEIGCPDCEVVRLFAVQPRGEEYVNLYGVDVTERRRAEEALRLSRNDLERAQAVGQIGSWRLNIGDDVLTWSDELYRIFGIPVGTPLTYQTFLERVHPDDRAFVDARWQAALGGEPYEIEHRIVVDGQVKWLREKAYVEFDDAGKLMCGFGIAQDITERRQTEEALRASLDRYWSFLDVTGQVGWTTNAAGEVTENMRAWRQFTGQSVEEIKGWGWSKAVHPDDLPYTVEVWQEAVEKRKKYETEYRLRRHDGVYRNFLARGVPTYNEDGSVREWVGTCIDITERKQAEESLRRANEELEQRVRDRTAELHYKNRELQRRAEQLSRFASELTLAEQRERNRLAKVLHDHLQQLLVAAKLGLHGLSQSITDEEVAGGIKDVYELIKQSIDTSRSLTVELSPTILHEAGLGAGLEWLARWMQHKHGLIVNLQLDEKAQTVREDIRILLFESVRELLFNVVKHAGVTRANVRLARRDDKLEIVVSDEGAGFDPRRVHEVDGAAGFGLFSIRERLELLGGSLKIESAPQRGAKFTLIAPTVYPVETVKARIERKREQTQAEPQEALKRAARGQTLRILIVDDHKVIRQGMAARLKREPDLEIAGEAGDGEEAIERAHALRPNVILMDYSMPRMDGVEATRRIHAALPEIRIIGLSMYQEADRAKAMYDAGAAAYVTKSAELDDLLRAIRANHTPK